MPILLFGLFINPFKQQPEHIGFGRCAGEIRRLCLAGSEHWLRGLAIWDGTRSDHGSWNTHSKGVAEFFKLKMLCIKFANPGGESFFMTFCSKIGGTEVCARLLNMIQFLVVWPALSAKSLVIMCVLCLWEQL